MAVLYRWSRISHVLLFWMAFILTRPLGATVGDLLDKPKQLGGLALSRPWASLVIAAIVVVCKRCAAHTLTVQAPILA